MAVNGIEIEVGQVWRLRNGETATVVCDDNHQNYPFDMADGSSRMRDGREHEFVPDGERDLIELLQPAETPLPTVGPATAAQVAMSVPGYETLAGVLQRAYNQAAIGKGVERHAAAGEPFHEQVMQIGAAKFGVGALLFQAFKKSEESQRLEHDRAINELLGSIVYLAGAVIAMEIAKGAK